MHTGLLVLKGITKGFEFKSVHDRESLYMTMEAVFPDLMNLMPKLIKEASQGVE
jgi:hypothetical protein